MDHLITETLEPPQWLPAATQGTIGIQCREEDADVIGLITPLKDADAILRTRAERTVATALQGSCQVPLAVFAELGGDGLSVSGMVGMPDGSRMLRGVRSGNPGEVDRLSAALADDLLSQGAGGIIASLS
jgi:hydroxymethylbilane synthase